MADRNAALQQEGTDLVDDAGTLADQARAHAMQRLQISVSIPTATRGLDRIRCSELSLLVRLAWALKVRAIVGGVARDRTVVQGYRVASFVEYATTTSLVVCDVAAGQR